MSHIVLIHGAWHGAWCWFRLAPLLEEHGHTVITPDLPGHGKDIQPAATVTLDDYTSSICRVIQGLHVPVMLVGHSMSGIVISQVAERLPERVSQLVYLAGFLLQDGQSMLEAVRKDKDNLVMKNLVYTHDRKTAMVRRDMLIPAFYGDCAEEDSQLAQANVTAQSLAPIATPVHVTSENWGRVPRAYIECVHDRAVTIQTQRKMLSLLPCCPVFTMETGHSPFLSAPDILASYIESLDS